MPPKKKPAPKSKKRAAKRDLLLELRAELRALAKTARSVGNSPHLVLSNILLGADGPNADTSWWSGRAGAFEQLEVMLADTDFVGTDAWVRDLIEQLRGAQGKSERPGMGGL